MTPIVPGSTGSGTRCSRLARQWQREEENPAIQDGRESAGMLRKR